MTNISTRTLSAPMPGPVVFDLTMPHGQISVNVCGTDRAEITLTGPVDGPGNTALTGATLAAEARVVTVNVPTLDQPGVTIVTGNGGRTIVANNINCGVIVSGGSVHISGSVINGQPISGMNVTPGVRAEIRLPHGSALRIRTKSAPVTARGELEWVDFASVSGDLDVGGCGKLTARTTSGDVRAECPDQATVRTVSGDVRLGRTETVTASTTSGDIHIADFGGSGRLTSVSGDITAYATDAGHLTASATSGDITVNAPAELAASGALSVDARSVSGDVRTPRPPATTARPRRARRPYGDR
ncbi:hypothetical protein GCM10009677_01010 [Sphaerisporangium rubeum]|uniref:DUF4097 domain-containing protein n=1 Tax=Sphaerisporangium rubeum TaxID=321317 RepID=A0A7X0IHL4_9ACTN|nr:DUF4097 family beta strand repeat-containing protein [Sphaerisporangium rubeum]MBB6475336.1 hypothetical protein [Sphaerisporangium rubeum]